MSLPVAAGHPAAPHVRTSRSQVMFWALWDWGGSAYSAVVVTFVVAPYLTSGVASDPESGSAALGWVTAAAGLLVAILAPAAGTRADARGRHRRNLAVFTGLTVLCTCGLFFIENSPAFLWWGLLLLGASTIFYELAEVSYNGMLLRISTPGTIGRISGFGWGLGYLGGLVLLVVMLFTAIQPEVGLFGATDEAGLRYRMVALASGLWFAVFALPLVLGGPRDLPPTLPVSSAAEATGNPVSRFLSSWAGDFRRVIARIAQLVREDRRTFWFLVSSAVYRDGLATIFAFAGVLAAGSYGFTATEVIYLGVAANLVAGIGAIAAGWFDDRLGAGKVVVTGILCLIAGALVIVVSEDPTVFWVVAMWMCLFVGPVQAASRSFLGRLIKPENAGEVFGLYATTGRAVSFLGPFLFASAVTVLGFQRAGAIGIVVTLVLGLALLVPVLRAGARVSH